MVASIESTETIEAGRRRKSRVDQFFQAFGNGVGNSIGWLADHYVLFGLFLLIWAAFGFALVASQGSLDQAWQAIRELPLMVQLVVWLLFLPVMIGLWVWEASGWNLLVRLILVIGVAGWNLLVFFPKTGQAGPPG